MDWSPMDKFLASANQSGKGAQLGINGLNQESMCTFFVINEST